MVAMEISISRKIVSHQLQSETSNWYKFHIDPSLGSLLNIQMKKLGMARKNCIEPP